MASQIQSTVSHLGLLVVTVAVFVFAPAVVNASPMGNALVNPGFETPETTGGGFVTTFGDWFGDISQIVTAENGISPREGTRMLKFLDASTSGPDPNRGASNVPQLVDLSALRDEIRAGLVVAHASAYFNRVAGDAETDTEFRLAVVSYEGVPSGARTVLNEVASHLISDGNVDTWQRIDVTASLPANTDYVRFALVALENVAEDGVAPEFDGHYADDAVLTFTVVPEPTTLFLSAAVTAICVHRRPKRPGGPKTSD